MSPVGHLYLNQISLAPSIEWSVPFTGWCMARVALGQGYWLGHPAPMTLNEEDMVIVFPNRKSIFRASQLGEMRLDYFWFCPELLTGFLTPAERHALESLNRAANKGGRMFPAASRPASWFAEVAKSGRAATQLELRCQLLQIVGLAFSRELKSSRPRESGAVFAGGRIRQLMNQLTEAQLLESSATGLAELCGCSVRHFNRLFLHAFGVSFRGKQSELRLAQARRLLSETDLSVKEIAQEVGFRHLGIFYAGFKRLLGMTPIEYRRRHPNSFTLAQQSSVNGDSGLGDSVQALS